MKKSAKKFGDCLCCIEFQIHYLTKNHFQIFKPPCFWNLYKLHLNYCTILTWKIFKLFFEKASTQSDTNSTAVDLPFNLPLGLHCLI